MKYFKDPESKVMEFDNEIYSKIHLTFEIEMQKNVIRHHHPL
jgi:hypothetical protein